MNTHRQRIIAIRGLTIWTFANVILNPIHGIIYGVANLILLFAHVYHQGED